MLRIIRGAGHDDRNAWFDTVVLADGEIMTVPRADLAAAKAVYAAQKAALRRMADLGRERNVRASTLNRGEQYPVQLDEYWLQREVVSRG